MPPKKKAPEPEPEPVDEGPKEVRARSAGDVLRVRSLVVHPDAEFFVVVVPFRPDFDGRPWCPRRISPPHPDPLLLPSPAQPSAADLWFQRKMASYASREQTAEKARVAAKAADDSRRALEANKADLRARELNWNVDRVARIAREIEDALAPARLERDARDRGARWTGRPKPIFVSYAPRDASFEELAFVRSFVASLDRAVSGDVDRARSFVWFDRLDVPEGDLGDDRARGLWRAEACAGAAAVVAVLSPAYEASEQCDLERFVVSNRREPVAWGGPAETVPVIAVDATKGAGFGPLGPTGAFASTPRGLLGEEDPNPTPLGLGAADAPRADAAAVAADVLEKLAARGVRLPIDPALLEDEMDEEDRGARARDGSRPALNRDGSLSRASSARLFTTNRGFRANGALDEAAVRASVAALGGSWRSKPLVEWSEEEFDAWFRERGGFLTPYLARFREERVDGWLASSLDDDALSRYFGVGVDAHRARILADLGEIGPGRRSDGKAAARARASAAEAAEASADAAAAARVAAASDADATALAVGMFHAADEDDNGYLDRWEFRRALQSPVLGLNAREIRLALDAVDDDHDGRVRESDFVPAVVDAIRDAARRRAENALGNATVGASTIGASTIGASRADVSSDSPPRLVSGHTRGELERALERAFAEADAAGTGELAPAAFRAALSRLDLGFTPRAIDAMCAFRGDAVDERDGRVSLSAFARVAFDIASSAAASDPRATAATRDASSFRAAIFAAFRDVAAGSETIPVVPHCRDALFALGATTGVGLTRAHVAAAIRRAPPCALAGRVAWREFVPLAADALWPRVDPRARRRREDAVAEARARGAWTAATGLDPRVVGAAFATTFARYDPTRRGVVTLEDAVDALDALVRERVVDEDVARAVRATATPPFTEKIATTDATIANAAGATIARSITARTSVNGASTRGATADGRLPVSRSVASVRYADSIDFWVDVAAEAERDDRADAAVAAVAAREAATAAREEAHRERRAVVDAMRDAREAEIRAKLREADLTGALESISRSPAPASAYLAAARVVEKFCDAEGVTRTGAAYVATLAMGTRDSARVIRIVAATEKHAFVVGKETRAWEGASWPAVGFERLERAALLPPPTERAENADPEASPVKPPPPVRTPPGTSRVVDLADAREGGAVALRGGDATPPGAFFAAPFVGVGDDAPRGYVAVDTVGWSSSDQTRASSNPGLISDEDKALVTRVAAAVSDALAKTAAETAKERERVRDEVRRAFEADEEGKAARREAALAALEERRAAAAAEAA